MNQFLGQVHKRASEGFEIEMTLVQREGLESIFQQIRDDGLDPNDVVAASNYLLSSLPQSNFELRELEPDIDFFYKTLKGRLIEAGFDAGTITTLLTLNKDELLRSIGDLFD